MFINFLGHRILLKIFTRI